MHTKLNYVYGFEIGTGYQKPDKLESMIDMKFLAKFLKTNLDKLLTLSLDDILEAIEKKSDAEEFENFSFPSEGNWDNNITYISSGWIDINGPTKVDENVFTVESLEKIGLKFKEGKMPIPEFKCVALICE